MIEEKDFFREGTRRICSSLEIEKSLSNFFNFIRQYIPADYITLSLMKPDLGLLELIAYASTEGDRVLPPLFTLTPEMLKIYLEKFSHMETSMYIVNHLSDDPLIGYILVNSGQPDDVALVMCLQVEEQHLGFVTICNSRQISYTQTHANLLLQLNDPFAIAFSNHLHYRELSRLRDLLLDDNRYFQDQLQQQIGEEIIGANFGLRQVMELVRHVAPQSSPVMLQGETGTGKEMIANAIHNLSSRKNGPLIKVNCGGIPDTLMDSELFGHEKGAFTGAIERKRGRFERAHKGTIFLDEIGELPLNAQVRLLRVLQEKEIERVGGTDFIPVDIRVIAATHRNLEAMVEEKTFRADLYFRLSVFPIVIPPLRERRGDIPTLAHYFIHKKIREMGLAHIPSIPPQSLEKLLSYSWPGNVRELQNVIERALILSEGGLLIFDTLSGPAKIVEMTPSISKTDNFFGLDEAVSGHILRILGMTNGKILGEKGAARLLDMNPSTLRKKMTKLKITFDRNKANAEKAEDTCSPAGRNISTQPPVMDEEVMALHPFMAHHILQALEKTGGKIAGTHGAANLLRINPSTLRKKMIKLGICKNQQFI